MSEKPDAAAAGSAPGSEAVPPASPAAGTTEAGSGAATPAAPPALTPPRRVYERRAHSPCMGVCRMDDDNRYCAGCLRTIDEIAAWSTATEETRWATLRAVQERRAALGTEK